MFFTYGANPISCVAANETLSIIKDDGYQAHAHELGQFVGSELARMKEKYPHLCEEVRGRGLMWGIELDPTFAAGIYGKRCALYGMGNAR